MNNTEIIEVTKLDGSTELQVVITHNNGSQTSMLKSTYDAQQEALANGNHI